jgi:polysaccharide pyruvyl transferase WcaK-like protein
LSINICFLGNGSYGNRGCEAIIRGSVKALDTIFPNCEFSNAYFQDLNPDIKSGFWDSKISYFPNKFLNPPKDLNSLKWWRFKFMSYISPQRAKTFRFTSISSQVKKSSVVLMVGGDNYSLDYGYPNTFFSLNNFVHNLDKPVVLWGASVGPFSKDTQYEEYATKELKKVNRIYARESITIKYLQSIGVEENVLGVTDPAFLMETEETQFPYEIDQMINYGAIGVNISPMLGRYLRKEQASDWIAFTKDIIYSITESFDSPVILIPHVTFQTPDHKSDDYVFLEKVRNLLPDETRARVALLGRNYNAAQTKMLISRLKIFVGARTHSTIASLSSAVPTLVLSYSIKGRGIIQDLFEDDQWLIEPSDLTPKTICEKIDALIKTETAVRNHLKLKLPSVKAKAMFAAEDLRDLIGKNRHE